MNRYVANTEISKDPRDPYTFWVLSGKEDKSYMVYFSVRKERWLCDCRHICFHPDGHCIHIATVKYYNRFLEYLKSVKDESKESQQFRETVLQEHAEIKD